MKNSSFLFFVCSQFVLSLVHSFVDSLMHWFPPSLIRFWIFPFHWFFHSNVHSLSHSPTDSFIRGALILSSHWFHLSHFIGIANTVRSHTDAPQNLNVSSLLHFMDSPIGQWFLMVVVFFVRTLCPSTGMRWFVDFLGQPLLGVFENGVCLPNVCFSHEKNKPVFFLVTLSNEPVCNHGCIEVELDRVRKYHENSYIMSHHLWYLRFRLLLLGFCWWIPTQESQEDFL